MCSGLQRRCVGWTMVVGWSVQVRFIAAINASHGGVKKRAEALRGNKVRLDARHEAPPLIWCERERNGVVGTRRYRCTGQEG